MLRAPRYGLNLERTPSPDMKDSRHNEPSHLTDFVDEQSEFIPQTYIKTHYSVNERYRQKYLISNLVLPERAVQKQIAGEA